MLPVEFESIGYYKLDFNFWILLVHNAFAVSTVSAGLQVDSLMIVRFSVSFYIINLSSMWIFHLV
jgi:hypothetical protein